MTEKRFKTECGEICYYISRCEDAPALVLLPGLTADHRLFDTQVEYFEGRYTLLTWDAPGHLASRPFSLSFSLRDKAIWLHGILEKEGIDRPVLIGQSMGGYVGQMYMQEFPGSLRGFISIDSAPLKRSYMKDWEIRALKKTEPLYRRYPWKLLLRDGPRGTSATPRGQKLMREMMLSYEPKEYAALAGHGYRMLADAVEADLAYEIDCPALLICGEKDKAGSAKRYNLKWTERSGIPLEIIPGAGHNANTDRPDAVNRLVERFVLLLS